VGLGGLTSATGSKSKGWKQKSMIGSTREACMGIN